MSKDLWRWTPGMVLGLLIGNAVIFGSFAVIALNKGGLAWGAGLVGLVACLYVVNKWSHITNSDGIAKYSLPVSGWIVRGLCYTIAFLYLALAAMSLFPRLI